MDVNDDDLLAEQRSYYRARAPEYDEWWQRQGRYDRGVEELLDLQRARPNGGDLSALLLRGQAGDLEQASRKIVNSGRIEQVIDVARRYAAEASAAIADIRGPSNLSRFPRSYLDWALEEFVAASADRGAD